MKKMISILFSILLMVALISGNPLNAAASDGSNLALNKEVSASSSYNTTTFATKNAVDGDMSTRWGNKYNSTKFNRGQGDTEETYTVNLGAVYEVATVKINWEAAHATTYTIQGSLDGETFFDIKDITEGKGGTESWYDFDVVETQYIRLAMHTCASQYGYSIWELEVYEPTDWTALDAAIEKAGALDEESYSDTTYDALYEAVMEGKNLSKAALQSEIDGAAAKIQTAIAGLESRYPNLALNKTVTASSTYSGKDANWLVDGNTKKTWQMNYATGSDYNRGKGDLTEEVTIDLGAAYAVDLINLTWKNGTFAKDVKVEGSLDNVNFFVMKEINDQEIASDKQVQEIAGIGAEKVQYVRFSLSDPNNVTYGYEIYEIEVFEKNPTTTAFTNLALHKPVVDNPSEYNTTTYQKANLTDGNISTRWGNAYSADAFKADPTETITIDLEDTYLLDRVVLNFEASYATKIKLLGSVDGNEYFEMKEATAASAGEIGITDLNSNVRYLRIYLSEPSGQYGFSIWEVKAYGSRKTELEKEWTLLNEKLANVEPGLEKGNMTAGTYYEYTSIADKAKALLESEDASYSAMRKSLLATKAALANFDEYIIDSEAIVDIYPTIQNIKYTKVEGMKLEGDVIDILVHGAQDVATLPKVKELLEAEGYSYQVVEEVGSNPVLILAVKCEEACGICTSVKDDANALEQAQGYVLETDKENAKVTIVGADADGVYYGVMTLKQIFEQKNAEGMIPQLVISDYPDTLFRGYVEGFYGFPWTTEERASLFEDTSKYKMTTYIYAPKDDPYHRDEWRELYPAEESKDIQELAAVATANNMDFCWTIHPGADYNYTNDNDENGIVDDFEKITAKLDQVYGLGVRQFGIFYDDLSSSKMDGPAHAALINDTYAYLTEKYDDVKPFITVTSRYNNNWGGAWDTYFTPFMEQVHEDTIVLWTGNHTMSGINKEYMEVPQTKTGVDRDLAVWWNYPVTDYCYGKLLMGSLDILDRDVDNINGFFLNPMSEADASKVAIFSGADYSWNISAFESQKSWERSIAELAGTANGVNKSFERFADNISFGSLPERKSNFEFDESKYLIEDIARFKTALKTGENLKAEATNLKEKFEQMYADVEIIRNNVTNENLLSEISLHLDAYEYLSQAGIATMNAYIAALNGDVEATIENMAMMDQNLTESGSIRMDTLRGTAIVVVGSHRIKPLLEESRTGILDILHLNTDYVVKEARMITNVDGLETKAVNKTVETYSVADVNAVMNNGDYIAIALPEAMNIYEIRAEVNATEHMKLQKSYNGLSWEDVAFAVEEDVLVVKEILTGAYVRLVCTADGTEAEIKEFAVTKAYEPIAARVLTDLAVYKTNDPDNAIDGSMETSFWTNDFATDGNYVCVDLGAPAELNEIVVYNGMNKGALDGYEGIHLEVSADGVFWKTMSDVKTIEDYVDVDEITKKITFDANGEIVRYFRLVASGTSETWTKIYEIDYDATYLEVESHVKAESSLSVEPADAAMDFNMNTCLESAGNAAADDYVSIDLGTMVPLYDASIYFGADNVFENVKLQTSVDGEDWTDAGAYLAKESYTTEGSFKIATFGSNGNMARYFRFVTGAASAQTVQIYEIKYNQTIKAANVVPSLSTSMTEYRASYTIDKAMDGDMSTKFYSNASQVKGDYVQVAFGKTVAINDYAIWFSGNPKQAGATDGFKEFQVQVSLDGTNWTDVGSKVSSSSYVVKDEKYLATGDLDGVLARFVRFTATVKYSSWLQIFEIEFNKKLDFSDLRYADEGSSATLNGSNLLEDKNVTTYATTYQTADGEEVVYPMTTTRDVLKLAVLQDVGTISNAKVSVQSMDGTWKEIGSLSQAWNEMEVNDSILAVKFAFDGTADAKIYEIFVYGGADYIKVEEALAEVPEDLTIYTEESVAVLETAIAAVERVKDVSEQDVVDGYAAAIEAAVAGLTYKGADYTAVEEALAKVPADLSVYTEETANAVTEAVSAVVRDKNITEQAEVDAMAQAIEDAVAALVLIPTPTPTEEVTPTPTETEAPVPTETEAPVPTETEAPVPTETEAPVPTETEAPVPTETEAPVPTETEEPTPEVTPEGPTDDRFDVPTEEYTVSAGSSYNGPEYAIDGNAGSHWEVQWDIGLTNPELFWYQIELDEATELDAVRYLPRWGTTEGDQNGFIEGYYVEVSMDGETWTKVSEGTWEMTEGWKVAEFDEAVTAKYVRLYAPDTWSDIDAEKGENSNLSIAEIRVRTTEPTVEITPAPTEEPTPEPTETEAPQPTETEAPQPTETEAPQPTETEAPQPTETEAPQPTETEAPIPTETEAPQPTETPVVKEDVTTIFTDVYKDWYTDYVQYVYDNGLMTGIKGTTEFQPNANITKAQVAQVLYNMEGQPEVTDKAVFEDLSDVYTAEWYADAVAWAYANGVVTGDLTTFKFNPNADVTREQLALMIFRYAKFKGYDTTATSDFAGLVNADKVANWSMDGVKWAVGAGLISGIEKDGVKDLAPQGNASRAQVAAILQRFCENVAK